MTAIKKIISIPLLALSVMPLLFSFYFIIYQEMIRQRMEERLEKSMLQTIHLKKEDLVWVKKDKEIRVGNHFFDVKSINEKNSYYEITGLYDKDEELLHEQLKDMNQNDGQSSQKILFSFFFHLYYTAPAYNLNEPWQITESSEYTCYYSLQLPSPASDVLSPPPNA